MDKTRYIVLIPLWQKNGRPQTEKSIFGVLNELGEEWGGYTCDSMSGGFWKDNSGNSAYDIGIPVWVDVNYSEKSHSDKWFREHKVEWEKEENLNQIILYITNHIVEQIM